MFDDSLILLRVIDRYVCRNKKAMSFFQLMRGIIEFEVGVHTCESENRILDFNASSCCFMIA